MALLLLVPTLKQASCPATKSQRNRICLDAGGQWAGGQHSLHRQKPRCKIHNGLQPVEPVLLSVSFLKTYSPETIPTDLTRCSPTDRCHNTSFQSQQPPHDNPQGIKNKSIFTVQNIKTQRSVPHPGHGTAQSQSQREDHTLKHSSHSCASLTLWLRESQPWDR